MSRCPTLVIVGRPNVGKSTLFNRLTRSRRALVADRPGVTRDYQSDTASAAGRRFTLVDTGGIGVSGEGMEAAVQERALHAARQGDVLIWLVDGRVGHTGVDQELAQRIRRLRKPCLLVVNKTENTSPELAAAEFHALGMQATVSISARHGDGVSHMLEQALALHRQAPAREMPPTAPPAALETNPDTYSESMRIVVMGRPNAGKSTLVNRLLGSERMLTSEIPGTTRDSVASDLKRQDLHYRLVDTPGVRRRARVSDPLEKFSVAKALEILEASDTMLLLVDARLGAAAQDVRLYREARRRGKSILVALNKWDGLAASERRRASDSLDLMLRFDQGRRVHPISALQGSGLGGLFKDLEYIRAAMQLKPGTARLTRILNELLIKHPPPGVGRGQRARLLHAHLGGRRPLRVILHGRRLQLIPKFYQRYLERGFSQALEPRGLVPIQVDLYQADSGGGK